MKSDTFLQKVDRFIGVTAIVAFIALLLEQTSVLHGYAPILKRVNLGTVAVFSACIILKVMLASDKSFYLKKHWFYAVVFISYVQFVPGFESFYSLIAMIRAAGIVVMLVSKTKKTERFVGSFGIKPAQLMIVSFFMAIAVGALLLTLPIANVANQTTSLLDAFFTATSATCVTGLSVKDTGTHFSLFGQIVILALIQIGGLGIMTFSVFLVLMGGKKLAMKQRIVMHDVLDQDSLAGAARLIRFIVRMTLIIEFGGAVALFLAWHSRIPSVATRGYYAVFHAISAFCNAGFSTFSDSLVGFSDDIATNVIISVLIILGGLGFIAIKDIFQNSFLKRKRRGVLVTRLKIQTKIVVLIAVILIVFGALAILAVEDSFFTPGMSLTKHMLLVVFQSISTRTAGFTTCDIGSLSHATLFIMVVLMFIGASPGSTGGGLKTTTFAVLWASMINGFSQNEHVEIYKRTIPSETIQKALTILLFYIVLLIPAIITLLAIDKLQLTDALFETVSAIATVGLSTGITSHLSVLGKVVILLLMFIGRLGPLTIGYALVFSKKRSNYIYAEERVTVG